MADRLKVGDLVWLPPRFVQLGSTILVDEPGRIFSIDADGWAMVDRGHWGHIGASVKELTRVRAPFLVADGFELPLRVGRSSPHQTIYDANDRMVASGTTPESAAWLVAIANQAVNQHG